MTPRCHYCWETKDLYWYREKQVCTRCLSQMRKLAGTRATVLGFDNTGFRFLTATYNDLDKVIPDIEKSEGAYADQLRCLTLGSLTIIKAPSNATYLVAKRSN